MVKRRTLTAEELGGIYDPYAEMGDIEGAVRRLSPPQPEDLLGGSGGGMSRGTLRNVLKVLGAKEPGAKPAASKAKKGSPYTLPREPRSTPKGDRLPAPAVQTKGTAPMVEKIFEHAAQERSPDYPMATEPVFAPADPRLTKEIVPQRSVAGELPPMPEGKFPLNERARPIWENRAAIGRELANTIEQAPGEPLPFYSTGTVLTGLSDKGGLTPGEAQTFMRDWAGQGAATSPRTKTPQNLRNAAYLMYRQAAGDPLTSEKRAAEGNRPGFAMMGMHTDLGRQFGEGTVDPWRNPKPYTFREDWTGNMADVVADTHNIRATLDAYDKLNRGGLSREWFASPEAHQRYTERGGFDPMGELPVGDIRDTLAGQMVGGREAQTEYPVMQGPTNEAARLLNISPGEAQERLWFGAGPRTGLRSPSMTIPDLFNAQIEKTARVLGLSPEAVMRLMAQRKIPLASADDMNVPGSSAVG